MVHRISSSSSSHLVTKLMLLSWSQVLTIFSTFSSDVCSFCDIAAAVPPWPEDVTVPVIVLFTIVPSCVTDCNFNIVRSPVTDLFVKCHLKLHIDITLHVVSAELISLAKIHTSGLSKSAVSKCGQQHTSHIANMCPLTKLEAVCNHPIRWKTTYTTDRR